MARNALQMLSLTGDNNARTLLAILLCLRRHIKLNDIVVTHEYRYVLYGYALLPPSHTQYNLCQNSLATYLSNTTHDHYSLQAPPLSFPQVSTIPSSPSVATVTCLHHLFISLSLFLLLLFLQGQPNISSIPL